MSGRDGHDRTNACQGYTYSVFNLVYETNTASIKIWDALGFKRIGRVKGAGNLQSHPEVMVDAIIYGRGLDSAPEDVLNEERFDKIREYLRTGAYPDTADRAEKGRLRSAAIHYRLEPPHDNVPERLMLRDKEVVSEPNRQFEIAHRIHTQSHGGINKTTAQISEKYHWVRIKETVSQAIKLCSECKEGTRPQRARPSDVEQDRDQSQMYPANASHDPSLQQTHPDQYPVYDELQHHHPEDPSQTQSHLQHQHQQQTPAPVARPAVDANLLSDYNEMMQSVDPSIVGDAVRDTRSASARLSAPQVAQGVAPIAPIGMSHYPQPQYPAPDVSSEVPREVYDDGTSGRDSRESPDEQAVQSMGLVMEQGSNRGTVRPFDRAFPEGQ